ncbi:hypothetical protein KEM55_003347, partial [Ascosphaera atra]
RENEKASAAITHENAKTAVQLAAVTLLRAGRKAVIAWCWCIVANSAYFLRRSRELWLLHPERRWRAANARIPCIRKGCARASSGT